jgi:hypothetical protein
LPERLIAQVMNIGTYDDVCTLVKLAGDDALRDVIAHTEIGWFNKRSWRYWYYRLGLAEVDQVPPMPTRSKIEYFIYEAEQPNTQAGGRGSLPFLFQSSSICEHLLIFVHQAYLNGVSENPFLFRYFNLFVQSFYS